MTTSSAHTARDASSSTLRHLPTWCKSSRRMETWRSPSATSKYLKRTSTVWCRDWLAHRTHFWTSLTWSIRTLSVDCLFLNLSRTLPTSRRSKQTRLTKLDLVRASSTKISKITVSRPDINNPTATLILASNTQHTQESNSSGMECNHRANIPTTTLTKLVSICQLNLRTFTTKLHKELHKILQRATNNHFTIIMLHLSPKARTTIFKLFNRSNITKLLGWCNHKTLKIHRIYTNTRMPKPTTSKHHLLTYTHLFLKFKITIKATIEKWSTIRLEQLWSLNWRWTNLKSIKEGIMNNGIRKTYFLSEWHIGKWFKIAWFFYFLINIWTSYQNKHYFLT